MDNHRNGEGSGKVLSMKGEAARLEAKRKILEVFKDLGVEPPPAHTRWDHEPRFFMTVYDGVNKAQLHGLLGGPEAYARELQGTREFIQKFEDVQVIDALLAKGDAAGAVKHSITAGFSTPLTQEWAEQLVNEMRAKGRLPQKQAPGQYI